MDVFDKEKRHKVMAAIRAKNTKPEIIVRKYLFSKGFRYRLYHKRLPGHPDLVMRKYRTCIFVNGCFWHGHDNCKAFKMPKTNTEFWKHKIERNKTRDKEGLMQLSKMGWHTIVVWECQLKPSIRLQTLTALEYTLNAIYLKDHSVAYREMEEEGQREGLAAESRMDTSHQV
ncbi:MAG: DNA mismatch endonuclease Vsr [Prevotella sp.]|nr:DNA mismatch endonuclease Vsr [Prevotella sp.]